MSDFSNTKTIDYAPLQSPVTTADIKAFRKDREHTPKYEALIVKIGYWLFGIFMLISTLAATAIYRSGEGVMGFVMVGSWAGVTVACIVIFLYISHRRYQKLIRLSRFASMNGFSFSYDKHLVDRTGMIFDIGTSRKFTDVLSSEKDGWEIGNYTYTTGSGKSSQQHYVGYIRLSLTRHLPHMVLDAKANNFFGLISNLPGVFDKSQTLSLEGDFDTHFTLYAPEEYKTDALYVFTPDVMASLIDHGSQYDMEAIDDALYIYSPRYFNLLDQSYLANLFSMISTIGGQVRSQSKRYADTRVGDRSQNVVAEQGRRLKKGINWAVILFALIIVAYYLAPTIVFEDGSTILPIVAISLSAVVAALAIFMQRKR